MGPNLLFGQFCIMEQSFESFVHFLNTKIQMLTAAEILRHENETPKLLRSHIFHPTIFYHNYLHTLSLSSFAHHLLLIFSFLPISSLLREAREAADFWVISCFHLRGLIGSLFDFFSFILLKFFLAHFQFHVSFAFELFPI